MNCKAQIFLDDSVDIPINCKQELHGAGLHTANLYNPSVAFGITVIYWNDLTALELNRQYMSDEELLES